MQKNILTIIILAILTLGTSVSQTLAKDAPSSEAPAYKFGVITLTHPLVIYRQYLPFIDYINKQLSWDVELVLYKEYADVVEAIKDGELDMALLGGNSFAQTTLHTHLEPIVAVLSRDKTPTTYSIIITKEDNKNINSIQDLQGKSMAFGPLQSTSSYIIPMQFLASKNVKLNDFKTYTNLSTHDAVLRAVLRGDYDAGAIGEDFAKRFIGHGIKVVAQTQKFPSFIIVACPNVLPEIRQSMQNLLVNIQASSDEFIKNSSDWPEILRNGFAPVVEKDYEVFRALPQK